MGREERKLAGVSLRILAPTDLLGLDSELPLENAGRKRRREHLFEASHTQKAGATQKVG